MLRACVRACAWQSVDRDELEQRLAHVVVVVVVNCVAAVGACRHRRFLSLCLCAQRLSICCGLKVTHLALSSRAASANKHAVLSLLVYSNRAQLSAAPPNGYFFKQRKKVIDVCD